MRSKAPYHTPGKSAVEMTKSAETKNLLKAICGYKDFDVRLLDQVTFRFLPDLQETVETLLEAAGRKVQKGMYLVEGQEGPPLDKPQAAPSTPAPRTSPANFSSAAQVPLLTQTRQNQREPLRHSDGTHSGGSRARGVLHEVVHSAVWIRREATVESGKVAVKKQGELVELFGTDESGDWARVEHEVYEGHFITGWMLTWHDQLGKLLEPAQQYNAFL
jgi:hypothetical protein